MGDMGDKPQESPPLSPTMGDATGASSIELTMEATTASKFGTPLFSMATEKETSNCLGCCRSEHVTQADFYPSILATRNKERHYACCCCELPWTEKLAAWPKYKVLAVQFDEVIAAPWCCHVGCLLPCCNTVVCGCCFPKTTTATLGLMRRHHHDHHDYFGHDDHHLREKTFVCDGSEHLKQQALEWVYGGITEGADEYHCAAHLRDADLITPGVMALETPKRH